MARKIHFKVLILKENFEDFERDFGIFTGIFMRFVNLLEIFGISARFCRTFENFQEFKGILEILPDFGIFLGFPRDFLGIFAKVYEDFQSNTPLV